MDVTKRKYEKNPVENQTNEPCYSDVKNYTETSSTLTNQNGNNVLSSLMSIIVVISTALVIFAAASNSITWHFQRFWGASGDFWQALWDKVLDTVGDDTTTIWIYGVMIPNIFVYWFAGLLYTLLDIYNAPLTLMRYKIQPGMNEPVDKKRLLQVVGWVLANQILITFPLSFGIGKTMEWRGIPPTRKLPTFHWVLFELAVLIIVEEIGFYYSHRLLHSKYLYKYIHKKHHEWTAPIAVTAEYAHPIEHIVSNLMPVFMGIFLMGSHVATASLWFSLAILATLHSHSGYHLPFLPSPEFHDFHHLKFTQNFGVIGVLDRLHGTDIKFRNTTAYQRHLMMLNLVPPREMFPDASPKQQLGK